MPLFRPPSPDSAKRSRSWSPGLCTCLRLAREHCTRCRLKGAHSGAMPGRDDPLAADDDGLDEDPTGH
jgi:hypothetical protein